jgi:DNA ligase D-like protein (predicted polymerase)/DNA ligase D-like protein (predicted 3'-phosphoesterase)
MNLQTYRSKRNFTQTPEPEGEVIEAGQHRFVVQEHHASQLHYDFRLEMGGVLVSWAIPKGPSLDPAHKRLAVRTEDHPVAYITFEGEIAEGNYGAGQVIIWDTGTYELVEGNDPLAQLEAGKLNFELQGEQLTGRFSLIRMQQREKQWLLMKSKDEYAEQGWELEPRLATEAAPKGRKKKPASKPVGRERSTTKKNAPAPPPLPAGLGSEKPSHLPANEAFAQRELSGDLDVVLGHAVVNLTHLERVYWPEEGYTKADLLRYYWHMAEVILPHLKDRPLILVRYPNGIDQPSFFQHDVDDVPDYVHTFSSESEEGRRIDYVLCQNRATLLYLANMGTLTQNPWLSRWDHPNTPDWMVFDLDPGQVPFPRVCEAALAAKSVLDRLDLESYLKASGSRGLHLYVPLKPVYAYEEVAPFAERIARLIARERPDITTVERTKKTRPEEKVYVDFLQNAHGKSIAAPYSVRAKPGATVSAPLDWSEVKRCPALEDFTIKTMVRRVAHKGDVFGEVLHRKQSLEAAMEKMEELLKESSGERRKELVR